jgi:phenylacetate-CoA ligase
MKTSLQDEREEQRRWRLRGGHEGVRAFDRLVENEFADPDALAATTAANLRQVVAQALEAVPYYIRLFRRLKLTAADIASPADLPRLPVMGKRQLARNRAGLRARALPEGDRVEGWFASSGTTGQPTKVLHSALSNVMFTYLAQRQYRWARMDPMGKLAAIRLAAHLPADNRGRPLADGESGGRDYWRYAGTFFETGPMVWFNVTNPVEAQLAWLEAQAPDYLQSYSESLEHLAFACEGHWPAPGIRKMQAVSEQLSPAMRRRIESTTGAEVVQNYGLNEIGLAAAQCAAGNYHVHVEHCIAEVVDDAGAPCAPGVAGRLVLTALKNPAMPLMRYDSGDMARAVAGPCPCGRTLPAFTDLVGRYSRIAFLPPGTLPLVGALRAALEELPPAAVRGLRQFQIHQFRDRGFELRLLTVGALPPGLAETLTAAWRAAGGEPFPLGIVRVESIARSPGGKFQDFTSDFVPGLDQRDD